MHWHVVEIIEPDTTNASPTGTDAVRPAGAGPVRLRARRRRAVHHRYPARRPMVDRAEHQRPAAQGESRPASYPSTGL